MLAGVKRHFLSHWKDRNRQNWVISGALPGLSLDRVSVDDSIYKKMQLLSRNG